MACEPPKALKSQMPAVKATQNHTERTLCQPDSFAHRGRCPDRRPVTTVTSHHRAQLSK